jgi:hypothetical protein
MKTKKIVIAVLTAALLFSVMLILGCPEQINELSNNDNDAEDNYQVPEGKGIVRLKLSDGKALTILPNFDNYTDSGNNIAKMYFEVEFTNTESDSNEPGYGEVVYFPGLNPTPAVKKASYSNFHNKAIPLTENETYSYIITAYNNDDGDIPIAKYTSNGLTNITVGSGTTVKGPFALVAVINSTYSGSFIYNISIPADSYANANLIEIKPASGLSQYVAMSVGVTDNGKTTFDNTLSPLLLSSGYYTVIVTLSKTNYLTKQYTEALHIYPGMNSKYELEVTDPLVQNKFLVTFYLNGKTETGGSYTDPTGSKTYGSLLSEPSPKPESTGYDFVGWSEDKDDDDGTSLWTFSTDRIFAATDLWAIWTNTPIPSGAFRVTMAAFTENMPPLDSNLSINENGDVSGLQLDGTNEITLVLGNPVSGGSWTNIEWFISEVDLSLVTTNTLVIRNNYAFSALFAESGTIPVSVTAKLNGVIYSATVNISVVHQ